MNKRNFKEVLRWVNDSNNQKEFGTFKGIIKYNRKDHDHTNPYITEEKITYKFIGIQKYYHYCILK